MKNPDPDLHKAQVSHAHSHHRRNLAVPRLGGMVLGMRPGRKPDRNISKIWTAHFEVRKGTAALQRPMAHLQGMEMNTTLIPHGILRHLPDPAPEIPKGTRGSQHHLQHCRLSSLKARVSDIITPIRLLQLPGKVCPHRLPTSAPKSEADARAAFPTQARLQEDLRRLFLIPHAEDVGTEGLKNGKLYFHLLGLRSIPSRCSDCVSRASHREL